MYANCANYMTITTRVTDAVAQIALFRLMCMPVVIELPKNNITGLNVVIFHVMKISPRE